MVSLAMEESRHILADRDSFSLPAEQQLPRRAQEAALAITGALFDIAEIYDADGRKLAEASTPLGERIEPLLPKHHRPAYQQASYESLQSAQHEWILRIFVPLEDNQGAIVGYFEGVRVVPA